jgi:predicted ATP-dependent protease
MSDLTPEEASVAKQCVVFVRTYTCTHQRYGTCDRCQKDRIEGVEHLFRDAVEAEREHQRKVYKQLVREVKENAVEAEREAIRELVRMTRIGQAADAETERQRILEMIDRRARGESK